MAEENKEAMEALNKKYDEIMGPGGKPAVDEAYLPESEEDLEEDFVDPREESKEKVDDKVVKESDKESEEASEAAAKEDEYEDIPDHLIEAGRAHGFTDETIIGLAENQPEVLEALAGTYQNYQAAVAQREEKPQEPEKKVEEAKAPEKLEHITLGDVSDFEPAAQETLKTFATTQNKLIDQLNMANEKLNTVDKQAAETQRGRQQDFDRRIDNFFDQVKDIPQFGNTASLTPAQIKARQEAYGMADVFARSGGTLEENLSKATKAYKGLYDTGESSETTLRRKLDKNKKRFSARPGGQKTKPKFKSEEDKVMHVMDEASREIGIEWTG